MDLGCQVLLGRFGPVYLLQVSKNDDEERCFLKQFGFRRPLSIFSVTLFLNISTFTNDVGHI